MKRCVMTLCIVTLAAGAWAQEKKDAPPPPKPEDNGPSLEATMKFIQDKTNGQGVVTYNWRLASSEQPDRTTSQQLDVLAEPATCSLKGKKKITEVDSADNRENTFALSFRDIKEITVESAETAWSKGYPYKHFTFSPPIFQLLLHAEQPAIKSHWKGATESSSVVRDLEFIFADEEMANRVAKALVHAVELCGGGSKPEPF
jgi:hypothetical protein